MKILFIITKSTEGGAQTHISQLSRSLLADGHEVAVMSSPGGWLENEIISLGGHFYNNPYFKNSYNPLLLLKINNVLKSTIDNFQPDIISCHSGFAGFVARILIRNSTPTIFTAHGWSFSPGAPLKQRVISLLTEKFTARWAQKIICVSEYDRQLALNNHIASPKKLITIHNGVEIPATAPVLKTKLSTIVFSGRLVNQKRPKDVVEALLLLPDEIRKELEVYFIGGGPLQTELNDFVAKHSLQGVHFLGNVSRPNAFSILEKSDVFVLPTNYEGLPRSILEAFSYGLPLLASGVAGIPEIIQNNTGYILTPGKEVEQLAEHITYLHTHPEVLKEMSERAFLRVKNHFSLEDMIKKTKAVYEEILQKPL